MNILVITMYYTPDLTAGSFRTAPLIEALRNAAPPNSKIDVITTAPNRYRGVVGEAPGEEHDGAVSIYRVPVGKYGTGMSGQAKTFRDFFRGAVKQAKRGSYDIVFATSGRLMTAALGAYISYTQRIPLYLDIRDIFVDNLRYIVPKRISFLARPVFSVVERLTIRRARKVNLVSRGFEPYFSKRYPRQRFSYLTNGIDDEFVELSRKRSEIGQQKPLSIVYAGNFGVGQGLERIVPQLAERLRDKARFILIGDGAQKEALEREVKKRGLENVELRPPVPRALLMEPYEQADVLFLHLNDYESFKTVLPSKIFEYGALGKPVWAGVGGYAAKFLREEMRNAAVFDPCDVDEAMRGFEHLELKQTPRPEFIEKYNRASISRALAKDIIETYYATTK